MIKSIGIRCSPSEICFAITESIDTNIKLIAIDYIIVPKALIIPEQLKFVRGTMLDILEEYQITNACIRITESIATPNTKRINLEAIIQELIASSTVERYYIGQISTIVPKLGIPKEDFKKIVDGKILYSGIDVSSYKSLEIESILSSISALNL